MEKSYQFTSRLGPADFVGLRLLLMYSGRRKYFWLLVIAASLAVLFLLDNYVFLLIVGLYLVFITVAVVIAALTRGDRDLYQEKSISMTAAGFAFKSPKHDENLDWEQGVKSYRKLGPYHIVYIATGGFVTIPDRDIPADDKTGILELLVQKS